MSERTSRREVFDFSVYALVRVAIFALQMLPWLVIRMMARVISRLGHAFDGRHRLIAQDNLRHAFPDLDEREIQRLSRASFDHFVIMIFEVIRFPRIVNEANLDDYFRYASPDTRERVDALMDSGRPLLVLTGHFGNWEVFNYVGGIAGHPANVIARRLDNPYVDRLIDRIRCKTGQRILDKRYDYSLMLDALERKEMLGMLGDQDAGPKGQFVDFLGRPASTYKSIALLSLKYSAPILVFGAARISHPMQYHLYLEDVILPEDYAGKPGAIEEITQRYSDALERLVRRYPEQYFWFHRRWKSKPKKRRSISKAA
jgi:KDO2-lipid IV(A) lauroyltransferase